jgi:antitoxin MazE2
MMSFRVSESEAAEAQRWAQQLGVDRSELLREALHRHLVRLASEDDAKIWDQLPLTADEKSFADVADWGPAEDWSDWSDWADATG